MNYQLKTLPERKRAEVRTKFEVDLDPHPHPQMKHCNVETTNNNAQVAENSNDARNILVPTPK